MHTYPAGLPLPLREPHGFEAVNNIVTTPLESGRTRQRVDFESRPDNANGWVWHLTNPQAQLFRSFIDLVGGDWFTMVFSTPEGSFAQDVRFRGTPTGPRRVGLCHWAYTANLEIRERLTLPPYWAQFAPAYVLLSDILDRAINVEKP